MGKFKGSGYSGLLEALGMVMVMLTVKPARAATAKVPPFFGSICLRVTVMDSICREILSLNQFHFSPSFYVAPSLRQYHQNFSLTLTGHVIKAVPIHR